MTPVEAAKEIGCSAQHVRALIRTGMMKATRSMIGTAPNGRVIYVYDVKIGAINRYKKEVANRGPSRGCPLGTKRKKKR